MADNAACVAQVMKIIRLPQRLHKNGLVHGDIRIGLQRVICGHLLRQLYMNTRLYELSSVMVEDIFHIKYDNLISNWKQISINSRIQIREV